VEHATTTTPAVNRRATSIQHVNGCANVREVFHASTDELIKKEAERGVWAQLYPQARFSLSAVGMYSINNLAMLSRTEDSILRFPDNIAIADISPVDFSSLAAGNESSAQTVCNSTRDYGFLYVKTNGVDSYFMFYLADYVLELPLEKKMEIRHGLHRRVFRLQVL
jgi:hypothetical protein